MIKFFWNNLVSYSGKIVTNPNAQFPASNLIDSRRTKVVRTTTNSDTVTFDFGVSSEIDSVFIVDNPIDGFGVTSVVVSASESPSFIPDLVNLPVSLNSKYGQGLLEFSTVTARYARLTLGSTLGYCELSKVFIGKKLELIDGKSINFGWTHKEEEIISKSFNRYGQQFTDLIGGFKEFNISFSNLTKDQLEQIDEMTDYVGTALPFFVSIGCPDITNSMERFAGMVYLNTKPTKTNTFFNRYSLTMSLREAT